MDIGNLWNTGAIGGMADMTATAAKNTTATKLEEQLKTGYGPFRPLPINDRLWALPVADLLSSQVVGLL